MSEINATIIVEPITLGVTQTPITQTVTVAPIDLSIFTAAPTSNPPGGIAGELQFNSGGNTFNGLANSNVSAGTLTFENLANLKITGGTANYGLITDGLGNLSWSDTTTNANFASYAGNVTVSSQPNITSTGTLTGLTVSGATDLGPQSNVTITGGTNGYVLGTDGAGTLSWVAQGGAGTGNPGGANTQIQFNDSGLFGGNVGFTFNDVSGIVNMPTDLIVGSDITSTSGIFTGDGGGLSNIQPGNIVGLSLSQIANGTSNVDIATVNGDVVVGVGGSANVASFFTGGANVNGDLNVVSDITSTSGIFTGDGGGLSNVTVGLTESVQLLSITGGAYNYDVLDGDSQYSTANLSSNLALNFRGNASTTFDSTVGTGASVTTSLIVQNGTGLPHLGVVSIDIDSVNQTINWVDGLEPPLLVFANNSFQTYQFTVIKTSAAPDYTVFAGLTRFGGT